MRRDDPAPFERQPAFAPDTYVRYLCAETPRTHEFRGEQPDDVKRWQHAFRPVVRRLLGLDAIASRGECDLAPELVDTVTLNDHIREEWTVQTEPGFRLPFYLLRPSGTPRSAGARRPVVITPHGHGKAGKRTYVGIQDSPEELESIAAGERDIALQAVREGYLAIAPDMRGFGSLRTTEDQADDRTSSCRTLQMHALLFGRTLVGERVHDVGRLIDFAATRPEADVSRVVITGNSGGGTVSLFAAACDERISVAVPGSYFSTFEDSIGSIYHCECNYIPGILRHGEMWDVAGLIAPRPFLAVAGTDDPIFPIASVRSSFERLRRIYEVAGARSRCRLSVNEGGHRYYKQDVWPFVAEVLSHQGEPP